MTSSPLDNTYGGMTSGMSCHHHPWTANTVILHRARYAITALCQHILLDDIGLAGRHRPWTANMSMLSSPYVRIHDRMTSRVTSSLESWAIFMVEQCREGHAIIVLGQHRRSDDVRHDIPSSPLVSTHGRTTSGLAWNHIPCTTSTGSYNVRRGMSSSPVDSIHG